MPGGARRQEMLDKAVDYLRTPGATNKSNMSLFNYL
jgi:hypothetical protein